MSCKVLDRFGIHTGSDQVRDICMTELMRCHGEIKCIHDILSVLSSLAKLRLYLLLDRYSVNVFIKRALLCTACTDIFPDTLKL